MINCSVCLAAVWLVTDSIATLIGIINTWKSQWTIIFIWHAKILLHNLELWKLFCVFSRLWLMTFVFSRYLWMNMYIIWRNIAELNPQIRRGSGETEVHTVLQTSKSTNIHIYKYLYLYLSPSPFYIISTLHNFPCRLWVNLSICILPLKIFTVLSIYLASE